MPPKITLKNVYYHRQYRAVINELGNYPDGLTLGDLVYLLTTQHVVHKIKHYSQKFKGRERQQFIQSRKRMQDILNDLRIDTELKLVEYEKATKKYRLKNLSAHRERMNEKIIELIVNGECVYKYHTYKNVEQFSARLIEG
jgi:hypothetical protein